MALRYSGGFGKPPSYKYGSDPTPGPAPHATGGKVQPPSPRGKTVKVKAHTRTVKPKPPKAPHGTGGAAPPAAPTGDQALINAAVRSRFAPQEQALNAGLAQNTRFNSGIGDWYSQALNEIKGLQAQGNAQAQATLGQITAYNSQPALQNGTDQQAAGARNNLNSEYAAMFGRDATANSDAMNRLAAAYAIQQGNTQNQAYHDRQQLLTQQGQLGQQKADYGLTYGAQLAQSENKQAIDQARLALQQGVAEATGLYHQGQLKNQQAALKSLSQNRTAGQKVARTNARTQRANAQERVQNDAAGRALARQRLTLDQWKATHPNSGKGSVGSNSTYSKSKIQGFRQNWDYARATAHQLKEKGTYKDKSGKVQNISTDVAYSALLNATKDPDIAKAASLVAFGKPIPSDLRHRLAVKGVHVADPKVGRTPGGGPYGTGRMEN